MKIRNLPLLTVLLCMTQSSVAATIESRSLKLSGDYADDMQNKIDAQAQEIRQLLGRIEVLEHSLAGLKERVDVIDNMPTDRQSAQINESAPAAELQAASLMEDDIFSEAVEVKKPAASLPAIAKTPNVDESKEKKLYDAALAALKDNRLEIAEEKFSSFINDYPKSSMQSNAYFWYGETFFKRNMFDKAAINYLKGYKQYPKGSKAADSLLKLALSLGELKKKTETCTMLTKLDAEFPSRPASSIKRAKDAKVKFGCK
jgi:tol-pal system protein YbgF